jgi:hypothetical protein
LLTRPEIKVSETAKYGKYVRTTEIYRDKVLVSIKREVSAHKGGRIDAIFTKLFRGGEMIYASSFYTADRSRNACSYYHQGKMVIEEGDEDRKGCFETMILFDAKEQPVEAFKRSEEGAVTQFSEEELSKLKETFAIINGEN